MKQKKRSPARLVVLLLAILVAAACVVLVLALTGAVGGSDRPEEEAPAEQTPIADTTATPETQETAQALPGEEAPAAVEVELAETEDMGQEYIDRFVFLGDSTTYGMGAYGIMPFTQIWTDSSGTLALFNWAVDSIAYYDPSDPNTAQSLSIPECAARRQPEYLLITLGINGIALLDEEEFKSYYTDLIQAVQDASPDTKIICHSIYPVLDSVTPEGIDNAGVNAAKEWIEETAAATGTRYLNSHDLLTDETGNMQKKYNNGDDMGIHLNPDGFEVVLNNIRTHGWQESPPSGQ